MALAAGPALASSAPRAMVQAAINPMAPAVSTQAPAPPPPASTTAPGTGLGSAPDLSGLVGQDGAYQQANADYTAALAAAAGNRDAAINAALINYGAVPDIGSIGQQLGLSQDQINAITGGIGSATSQLANQYTQSGDSVLGQLNQAHQRAIDTLRAQLAGRGTLESGATGVGLGLEGQNYQQNMSKAYQALMQSLLGYENNYDTTAERARNALENAASAAYNRAATLAEKYPGLYSGNPSQVAYNLGAAEAGGTPLSTGALSRSGLGVGGALNPNDPYNGSSINGVVPVERGAPSAPRVDRNGVTLTNPYTTGRKRFG